MTNNYVRNTDARGGDSYNLHIILFEHRYSCCNVYIRHLVVPSHFLHHGGHYPTQASSTCCINETPYTIIRENSPLTRITVHFRVVLYFPYKVLDILEVIGVSDRYNLEIALTGWTSYSITVSKGTMVTSVHICWTWLIIPEDPTKISR